MFIMATKDRFFTQFATEICYGEAGVIALNMGNCPICKGPAKNFRDALSLKEYNISGMCQKCQDEVFA